jgi:hypothetical protein
MSKSEPAEILVNQSDTASKGARRTLR